MYIANTAAIGASSIVPRPPLTPGTYDVHVLPNRGYWTVKSEHSQAYHGYWLTQVEAIAFGMNLARESAASLIVHRKDGTFGKVYNYTNWEGPRDD